MESLPENAVFWGNVQSKTPGRSVQELMGLNMSTELVPAIRERLCRVPASHWLSGRVHQVHGVGSSPFMYAWIRQRTVSPSFAFSTVRQGTRKWVVLVKRQIVAP